jgi:hypothetical protein
MGRLKGVKDTKPRKKYKTRANVLKVVEWICCNPKGGFNDYMHWCFSEDCRNEFVVNNKVFYRERKKLKENGDIF